MAIPTWHTVAFVGVLVVSVLVHADFSVGWELGRENAMRPMIATGRWLLGAVVLLANWPYTIS